MNGAECSKVRFAHVARRSVRLRAGIDGAAPTAPPTRAEDERSGDAPPRTGERGRRDHASAGSRPWRTPERNRNSYLHRPRQLGTLCRVIVGGRKSRPCLSDPGTGRRFAAGLSVRVFPLDRTISCNHGRDAAHCAECARGFRGTPTRGKPTLCRDARPSPAGSAVRIRPSRVVSTSVGRDVRCHRERDARSGGLALGPLRRVGRRCRSRVRRRVR